MTTKEWSERYQAADTNSHLTHENKLNVISHQGTENQNHNESLLDTKMAVIKKPDNINW